LFKFLLERIDALLRVGKRITACLPVVFGGAQLHDKFRSFPFLRCVPITNLVAHLVLSFALSMGAFSVARRKKP
jgi:hypothetical protein